MITTKSRHRESGDPVFRFEIFESPADAIKREKQLKKWNRVWKLALIEKLNPGWTSGFPPSRERPGAECEIVLYEACDRKNLLVML